MVQRGKVESEFLADVELDPYGWDPDCTDDFMLVEPLPAWITLQDVIEETLSQARNR